MNETLFPLTVLSNPARSEWAAICRRPAFDVSSLFGTVRPILERVRRGGDAALRELEETFDRVRLDDLRVSNAERAEAAHRVPDDLKRALHQAADHIRRFHEAQRFAPIRVETAPGVVCEQRAVPIERVGLYVPGGSAPLFSTVLMLGIPARIAGCRTVVLCTPPSADGTVHPAILYAATLCGIDRVCKVGGAQAVAAMAFGTESVPRVDKIFGPGNQYVMAAKQLASLADVAIDMPAGPSEVAVLADASAQPAFVAADLLSQAEHGPDSQAVLVATDPTLPERLMPELQRQLEALPRRDIAERALSHSRIVVFGNEDEAVDFVNEYAPEHLILAVAEGRRVAGRILHAGSVFIGHYSSESAGDYASGTNHTLPTRGYARAYGGLCLDSFVRKMTLQELTPEGVRYIGPAVETMAAAEQLQAHRVAMQLRRTRAEEFPS